MSYDERVCFGDVNIESFFSWGAEKIRNVYEPTWSVAGLVSELLEDCKTLDSHRLSDEEPKMYRILSTAMLDDVYWKHLGADHDDPKVSVENLEICRRAVKEAVDIVRRRREYEEPKEQRIDESGEICRLVVFAK